MFILGKKKVTKNCAPARAKPVIRMLTSCGEKGSSYLLVLPDERVTYHCPTPHIHVMLIPLFEE